MMLQSIHYWAIGSVMALVAAAVIAVRRERMATVFNVLALAVLTAYMVYRAFAPGTLYLLGALENMYLIPFYLLVFDLVSVRKISSMRVRFAYRIFLLLFLSALLFWPSGLIPPHPQKMHLTVWLFFVFEGCALAGFLGGGLLLAVNPAAKKAAQTMLLTAFVAYSAAQITGAIWCVLGWGATFMWSSRHFMSAAIWLYYAGWLHLAWLDIPRREQVRRIAAVIGALFVLGVFISGGMYELSMNRMCI